MNSKQFQFNRRGGVALGLAILILSLTILPALAWEDEGGPDFQSVQSCSVGAVGEGLSPLGCGKIQLPHSGRVISERPIAPLGVMRAEALFLRSWQPTQPVVEAE